GLYLARPAEPARAPAPAIRERVVVERPGQLAAPRGPSLDEIRAAVREEMAQRTVEEPAAAPPARSEEAIRTAVAKANAAVAEGIRRGVWSERERGELRAQLVQLGTAELHEVLSPLFQAINAQQLRLEGPPI
ncbi:MAG TPA: hypothetical protein VN253_12685, partial [Kofleriaceae bacterium]|nr:hypothetical protein [Kofleriaceae bacterium]